MVTNYFTLVALVAEWQSMVGYRIGDAYSQHRGELTLALYRGPDDETWSIRIATAGSTPSLFRYAGHNRPKKNVTPLFDQWWDRPIVSIRVALRDRFIQIRFEGGSALEIMPFGPRANVFVIDEDRIILEAFRKNDELSGTAAPSPQPAPDLPNHAEELRASIEEQRGSLVKRISRALPLVNRIMATEVCFRADAGSEKSIEDVDYPRLHHHLTSFRSELDSPAPTVYYEGGRPKHFGLIPLHHLQADFPSVGYDSVDEALRIFIRGRLAAEAFDRERDPLIAALEKEERSLSVGLDRMMEELAGPSRADRYERDGHLLMARASTIPEGLEEVTLPNLFGDGDELTIRLDPALSVIQNAERLYEKARHTRDARKHAERRLEERIGRLERIRSLIEDLRRSESLKEVKSHREKNADLLTAVRSSAEGKGQAQPYRTFDWQGYDILVGRSARHNDRLTFGVAGKFDLWLHARGVAGSHVIIPRNRNEQIPPSVIRHAAGLAAWFSKARGSSLVPVILTERKFVRRAKGGGLGAVVVEREEVLMVQPQPPGSEGSG